MHSSNTNHTHSPRWLLDGGAVHRPRAQDHSDYLLEITSYSSARLAQEPDRLRKEQELLEKEAERLAVDNYQVFLSSGDALACTRTSLQAMCDQTSHLVQNTPRVQQACDAFADTVSELYKAQRSNAVMKAGQMRILEVLELPQLMATCVRTQLFQEALDLHSHTSSLRKRFPDVPILEDVLREMDGTIDRLKQELLSVLQTNTSLPRCLKTVALLRRMDFTEQQLRQRFLERRGLWLDAELAAVSALPPKLIPKEVPATINAAEFLSNFLNVHRMCVFDIVTQYRAIFVDDSSAADVSEKGEDGDGGLLFVWVAGKVSRLLDTLGWLLPGLKEGSFVSATLQQCMACGVSLGHVGIDFRALVIPLFEQRVSALFAYHARHAVDAFQGALSHRPWHVPSVKDALASSASNSSSLPVSPRSPTDTVLAPQESWLEFPSVALVANALVAAFNNLSHCAPYSTLPSVQHNLTECLQCIASHVQSLQTSLTPVDVLESSSSAGAEDAVASVALDVDSFMPSRATALHMHANATPESLELKRKLLERISEVLALELAPFVCNVFERLFEPLSAIHSDALRQSINAMFPQATPVEDRMDEEPEESECEA